MMRPIALLFPLLVVCCCVYSQGLSKADQAFLDQLLEEVVYRPSVGQQYVVVKQKRPSCWGEMVVLEREGWLNVEGTEVYFTDGETASVGSLDSVGRVDFLQRAKGSEQETEVFARMQINSMGVFAPSYLVTAAWLHAWDKDDLAASFLLRERKRYEAKPSNDALKNELRKELAWSAYSGLVHCYMMRMDSDALAHAQRFRKRYLDHASEYPQFAALERELERRKVAGTFNSQEVKDVPTGFDGWDQHRQIAYLIGCLDEVDQRQDGQPGGVSLAMDWRLQALIAIGDSAVPALIEVIETDRRFTRSVHFWRDFSTDRTVLNVKEAALSAIMSIWQDPVFEPVSTGDNFTSHGEAASQALAAQLREQAKQYAGRSLDQRKLEVLLDSKAESYLREDAAMELARFGYRRNLGTTVWSGRWVIKGDGRNPLIEKYNNPTLAEMIWQVMHEELVRYDREADYTLKAEYRTAMEVNYLGSLMELNDPRILPLVRKAYQDSTGMNHKRQFAYTGYYLGDTTLWMDYCSKLASGAFTLPPIEYRQGGSIEYDNPARQPGNLELSAILGSLENIGDSVSMETLHRITRPGHPYYPWIEKRIIQLTGGYDFDDDLSKIWFHPAFAFEVLGRCLDNKTECDITLKCYEDSKGIGTAMDWGGQTGIRLHEKWEYSDYGDGKDYQLRARVCDMAAHRLYQLIFGIPACHGMMKDKDERIQRQKEFLARFRDFRPLAYNEYHRVSELSAGLRLIPVMERLDHPATQAEVEAGKALFTLNGEGTLSGMELPAVSILKSEEGLEKPMRVYIVQAELDANGKLVYGAFTEDGPKVYHEGDLVKIVHLPTEKE